jgi:hypothetical protein
MRLPRRRRASLSADQLERLWQSAQHFAEVLTAIAYVPEACKQAGIEHVLVILGIEAELDGGDGK